METSHTNRGFALVKFQDANGVPCSIQKSSQADDDYIWLGADDIGLKEFVAHRQPSAWVDVELGDSETHHYVANTRMHLSRDQVRRLLPLLKRFADTGELD